MAIVQECCKYCPLTHHPEFYSVFCPFNEGISLATYETDTERAISAEWICCRGSFRRETIFLKLSSRKGSLVHIALVHARTILHNRQRDWNVQCRNNEVCTRPRTLRCCLRAGFAWRKTNERADAALWSRINPLMHYIPLSAYRKDILYVYTYIQNGGEIFRLLAQRNPINMRWNRGLYWK